MEFPSVQSLVVENLCKSYDSKTVVNSLSFSLNPGEVLGILGRNGAGKTTSVAMLYGAVKADSGSSRLMPSGLMSYSSQAMRSIGIVTQENSLDPDFDLRTNLRLFGKYHQIPSAELYPRVESLLEQLELSEFSHFKMEQLSGGLLRRAVLARALVSNPQFIFLDEPTTGFDPEVRQQFWGLLLGLKSEGRSILLTTHYMDEAYRLCDRLILMHKGEVLDQGTPKELIDRWIGTGVIEVSGLSRDKLSSLFPDSTVLNVAQGHILTLPSHNEEAKQILSNAGASSINFRSATLDDVFLTLSASTATNSKSDQG